MEGVDYAFDKPSISGLATVGKRFACRYVGEGSASKLLTPAEAKELSAHGLAIVSNVEGVATGLLGGRPVGRDWASSASAHAALCGAPSDAPIYLSVDFDCTVGQWDEVREALRGAAEAIGPARVGVYGSFDVIEWAARDRVARWFWQTYAWSNGRVSPHAMILQYRNHVSLVGGTVDLDRSYVNNFGQWKVGEGMAIDPADATTIAQRVWSIQYGRDERRHTTKERLDDTFSAATLAATRAQQILDAIGEPAGTGDDGTAGGAHDALLSKLDEVLAGLREVTNAPLIDAVAVANAIAANPDVADTLARQVADRLASVHLDVNLTGQASGGIRPPTT